MALIVPDASVILKWVLVGDDEPDQSAAEEIRSRWLDDIDRIILPPLWRYEVANVLALKRPQTAAPLMDLLIEYEFEEADVGPDVCRLAFDIVESIKCSFYDAVYHALAIASGAVLITADRKYFNKARARGDVRMLEDVNRL